MTRKIYFLIKTKLWILDDNSDENEALEFGSDDYGSDGSQDEEDVSFLNLEIDDFLKFHEIIFIEFEIGNFIQG